MASRFLRRRRFLIKPGNQLRLTVVLVVSFLIYSAILGLIVFMPLASEFTSAANFEEQARLSSQVLELHARLWPAVVVVAALVGLQVVFMSHRFFGPIYRFEMALEQFLRGDFSRRIKLRKHDNLKEMESLLNRLADRLEAEGESTARLRESTEKRLAEALDALGGEGGGDPERARRVLNELATEVRASGSLIGRASAE